VRWSSPRSTRTASHQCAATIASVKEHLGLPGWRGHGGSRAREPLMRYGSRTGRWRSPARTPFRGSRFDARSGRSCWRGCASPGPAGRQPKPDGSHLTRCRSAGLGQQALAIPRHDSPEKATAPCHELGGTLSPGPVQAHRVPKPCGTNQQPWHRIISTKIIVRFQGSR
jgi:hypothetical protein